MGLNLPYLKSLIGVFKIISIIVLIMAYSFGMYAYVNSEYNKNHEGTNPSENASNSQEVIIGSTTDFSTSTIESIPKSQLPILWMERFHLIVTGGCTLIALVYLVALVIKEDLIDKPSVRAVDFGFHFFGAIFLIISAIFMAYTSGKIESISDEACIGIDDNCQQLLEKRMAAGAAFIAAAFFLAICIRGFGRKFYQTV